MTPPAAPIVWPPLAAVYITAAVALVASWIELAIVGFRKAGLGEMVWTGWQTAWTTPASWLLLTLPLGIGLAVVCPRLPRSWGTHLAAFAPAFTAAFCVAFMFYPALHPLAILLLSLGVAVQLARGLARRLVAATLASRKVVAIGVALVALTAALVHGGRALGERRAMADLPAPAAGAPNILIIVLDAVRAQNLGLYGYPKPTTPTLDRLGARGAVFTNAFATAPWTLPTHATLFTGRYHHETQADWLKPLEQAPLTLGEVLARRGYATGGFVANVAYTSRETGVQRGFIHYEDYLVTPAELVVASSLGRFVVGNPRLRRIFNYWDVPGRKWVDDVSGAFLRWQRGLGDRPFLAFLNLYDAHEPYLPPAEYQARFPPPVTRRNALIRQINARMAERTRKERMTADGRAAELAAYDASIALADDGIKRLLEELERRSTLHRTIVVITADHGELFGEHELFSHGNSLYRPVLHVPLIVVNPGLVPAARLDSVVSLRDLPATLLALAGATDTMFPGRTLLRQVAPAPSAALAQVNPAPNQDTRYPSSRGVMHSVVAGGFQYIRHESGIEELYAVADTAQARNLALEAAADSVLAAFRVRLGRVGVRP